MDTEKLQEYLDAALVSLGNAISVLEDANDEHLAQKLRNMRADIIYTIDGLEQRKPQGDINYGASCEHVHPGQSCGEWIRSQVYRKL
jgi:hypothetical protein